MTDDAFWPPFRFERAMMGGLGGVKREGGIEKEAK